MNCQTTATVARGTEISRSQSRAKLAARRGTATGPAKAVNPLERLVAIMRSNERLMGELAASRERIDRARAYLDAPGSNPMFGSAHLDRCRAKHSGILAELRANRIEALALLAPSGSEA